MELLLVLILLIPALGAIFGAFAPTPRAAKGWALLVSLATAAVAAALAIRLDWKAPVDALHPDFFSYEVPWLSASQIHFHFKLGVDAVSLWLVLLTVLLTPLAIAASFQSIKQRQTEYYAWMLALLVAMNGVFLARDLLLFYIFFELTLIPMFFIIGIWGGPERRYAAGKFFLFTFAGSVFTLAAAIYLGIKYGTFDIHALVSAVNGAVNPLTRSERLWVLLAFLAGFGVKVPLFPVHTWLPLAHTEAPTAGSAILAGVLLKLGTYGLYKLALPIGLLNRTGAAFPAALQVIGVICLIGIIYGALVAWVQQDIKKLVAYSSVSHLGFCVLGLVALNAPGLQGSVLYMINHGLSTGALFLVVGMIYDRYHTRDINQLSGLARQMPKLAFFFVLFALSSIGLPGLNGFVSEFLTILAAFTSSHLGIGFGVFAALGIILGAVYMLHMVARVIFGPLRVPAVEHGHGHEPDELPPDLNAREVAILIPLALAVVLLGVVPNIVLTTILPPINQALAPVTQVQTDSPLAAIPDSQSKIQDPRSKIEIPLTAEQRSPGSL